jgi:4-hydroxy-tetrahydrodipicolinate synthase
MNVSFLRGTGVALITPFDEHFEIDLKAHQNIIDFIIDGGINYLVVLGTTGESVTLKPKEKQLLIDKTVEFAAGRVPVIAGFGGNDTRAIVEDLESFDIAKVDAILSVSPSYNKPTQEGIYAHFKAIANATDKPIVLYNVPGRTSSNIAATTTYQLAADFKNIIGIKEATYSLEQITYLAQHKPSDFYLLSGCDDLIFHEMALGFDGVISVAGNVIPKQFSTMINLCLENKFLEAGEIHKRIYDFIFMLFRQGNPAGAKAVFKHLGLCEEFVRLPLVPVNEELRALLGNTLKEL